MEEETLKTEGQLRIVLTLAMLSLPLVTVVQGGEAEVGSERI